MSEYEVAVLFDPQLSVDMDKATEKAEKIIKNNAGKIVSTDNWGKKNLAYNIGQHSEAIYVFYKVEIPGENVAKMETNFNIADEIIRYLVVKIDHKKNEKIEKLKELKKAKSAGKPAEEEKE